MRHRVELSERYAILRDDCSENQEWKAAGNSCVCPALFDCAKAWVFWGAGQERCE